MRVIEDKRLSKHMEYWLKESEKEPIFVTRSTTVVAVLVGVKHLTKEQIDTIFAKPIVTDPLEKETPLSETGAGTIYKTVPEVDEDGFTGDCHPNGSGGIGVLKKPMLAAVFCEHANESGMNCRCPEHCYCRREGSCKKRKTAEEIEAVFQKAKAEMDWLGCRPPEAGVRKKKRP